MFYTGVALTGCQFSSFLVNHIDIAPKYAGVLMGLANSISAVTGFLAPYVIGVITIQVSLIFVKIDVMFIVCQ